MQDTETYLQPLKAKGYRSSRIREAVCAALLRSTRPLSVVELRDRLGKAQVTANKTTVYRILNALSKEGVVRELSLGGDMRRFELAPETHHHHVVCVGCGKIEDVVLDENLAAAERRIAKTKGYRVLSHSLEFFGICGACATSAKQA